MLFADSFSQMDRKSVPYNYLETKFKTYDVRIFAPEIRSQGYYVDIFSQQYILFVAFFGNLCI
jgi:hypothetical protein